MSGVELELGRPTDRHPPFKYSAFARVGFSDTDAQGVVYYGRYLPFFDLARVEYHRHLSLHSVDLGETEFVMRAASIEYFAPARFDDLLEIYVRVARIGRTSAAYEFVAHRAEDDLLLVRSKQTAVLIDKNTRRAVPIGAGYRQTIGEFEGSDCEIRA